MQQRTHPVLISPSDSEGERGENKMVTNISLYTVLLLIWLQFYNDYGDIIKATLGKAREINKVSTAKTLALSLTQLYKELQMEMGAVDRSSEAFQSLKVSVTNIYPVLVLIILIQIR